MFSEKDFKLFMRDAKVLPGIKLWHIEALLTAKDYDTLIAVLPGFLNSVKLLLPEEEIHPFQNVDIQ